MSEMKAENICPKSKIGGKATRDVGRGDRSKEIRILVDDEETPDGDLREVDRGDE